MKKAAFATALLLCAAWVFCQPKRHLNISERNVGGAWGAAVMADGSFLSIGLPASMPISSLDPGPGVVIPCHGPAPKPSVQTHRWIVRGGERLTWYIRFDHEPDQFRSTIADAHRNTVSDLQLQPDDLKRILRAKRVEIGVRFYPDTRISRFSFFPEGLDLGLVQNSCPSLRGAL